MPQFTVTRRQVAGARLQARARAESNDVPLIHELNIEARKLGFRGWKRLINFYRSQYDARDNLAA